jgi:uncharacterized membrane protein
VALSRGGPQLASASGLVYEGAGRICHQRPERSFTVAGVQQPVCARCFGLYAAGALGALLGWSSVGGKRDRSHDRNLLILCAAPTAVTFGLEFVGIAYPSSAVRAIAAVPLGIASGWVFVRGLREEAGPPTAPSGQPR